MGPRWDGVAGDLWGADGDPDLLDRRGGLPVRIITGDHSGSCPPFGRIQLKGVRVRGDACCPCLLQGDVADKFFWRIVGEMAHDDREWVLKMRVIVGVAMLDSEVG